MTLRAIPPWSMQRRSHLKLLLQGVTVWFGFWLLTPWLTFPPPAMLLARAASAHDASGRNQRS